MKLLQSAMDDNSDAIQQLGLDNLTPEGPVSRTAAIRTELTQHATAIYLAAKSCTIPASTF